MRHKATKLEAWVEVSADEGQNWEVLDEYRAEYTKDTAKCYVEAKAGQQFRMLWRDTDYMHKRGTYLLEGFYDGYAAGALAVTRPLTNIPACFEGVQNSDTTILPFMFEKIRTTDDDLEACDDEDAEDVGKLHISVWRATFGEEMQTKAASTTIEADIADAAAVYSEELVKNKTDHVVALGKEQKVDADESYSTTFLDPEPLLSFCFHYLSKAMLDLKLRGPTDKNGPVGLGRHLPRQAPAAGPSHALKQHRRVPDKIQTAADTINKKRNADVTFGQPDSSIQIEIQKLMAENKRLKKHLKRNRKIIPGKIIDLTDD